MYMDKHGSIFFTDAPTHSGFVKIKETPKTAVRQKGAGKADKRKSVRQPSNNNVNKEILYKNVSHTAKRHNIDPDLIWAIIKMESNFNSEAISPKGAVGLMQLMPTTAKAYDVSDPFNPHQNIEGGIKYMRYLLIAFNGDLKLSLAAYNAGERTVLNYKNIPPFSETEMYVKKVISFYGYLKQLKEQ
ncbi:MAG: lytic transglycosylase domain-containing protein [Nitrospinota bacterium]